MSIYISEPEMRRNGKSRNVTGCSGFSVSDVSFPEPVVAAGSIIITKALLRTERAIAFRRAQMQQAKGYARAMQCCQTKFVGNDYDAQREYWIEKLWMAGEHAFRFTRDVNDRCEAFLTDERGFENTSFKVRMMLKNMAQK